jgi:hypothetical protein
MFEAMSTHTCEKCGGWSNGYHPDSIATYDCRCERPPPPVPSSVRYRFEAWISSPPFEQDTQRWPDDETRTAWPGHYKMYQVQLAWEAWQEALNRPS